MESKEAARARVRAWIAANPERHRANVRAWRAANPGRRLVYDKAWREANSERVRAWHAANKEQKRAYDKARYAANPERYRANGMVRRAAHPERKRALDKAWYVANPERCRVSRARRRARIAQVLSTLTLQEWEAILEAAGRACIYCGSQGRLTQDHLTPISRGGPHTADNVAPACKPCNSSKGARTVMEFLTETPE